MSPTTKNTISASAAISRTSMIRLIANGVPSNRNAGGKKSEIDGGWNPPPSPEAARSTVVARLDRAVSPGVVAWLRRTTVAASVGPGRGSPES